MRPGATRCSPFRIWTSVPQIVVVVMRIRASPGPTSGTRLSSRTMRPGATKVAAFIVRITLLRRHRLLHPVHHHLHHVHVRLHRPHVLVHQFLAFLRIRRLADPVHLDVHFFHFFLHVHG